MKILLAFYNINNLGGIINHTENLIAGLKELEHTVEMAQLHWRDTVSDQRCLDPSKYGVGEILPVAQGAGWLWNKERRWPYKGDANIERWCDYASSFDIVIWQIPVPTKQKDNRGNTDWLHLYDHGAKNIIISHDGNFAKANGHIQYIQKHITAMACVHPCAYHGAKVSIPKALILNPQYISLEDVARRQETWSKRSTGFLSCQTFKAWKHVDDLVCAIPYSNLDKMYVAGGGIEHNYMTSVDKCKPQYKYEDGSRIWDVALEHGMEFLGYVNNNTRDKLLNTVRTLVDPSWSVNYSNVGDHFNRVVVDAMIQGCIPVARNFGISTNYEGNGEVFKDKVNYFMIPHKAAAPEFGEGLNYINTLFPSEVDVYHKNALKLLPSFERKFVAQQFIELSELRKTGWYNNIETSEDDANVLHKGQKLFNDFFDA